MKTNSRKVGRSGEITRRNTAKMTVFKHKVAVYPIKQKIRSREEGQRMRKVGRAVTFDASESGKETRERLRGGAKNHRQEGLRARGMRRGRCRGMRREATGTATGFAAGAGILRRKDSGRAGDRTGRRSGRVRAAYIFLAFLRLRSCNSLLDLIY